MGGAHTPTPWRVAKTKDGTRILGVCQETGEGITDSRFALWGNEQEASANAAFIVRAANAHEGLVAALKATTELYCDIANSGDAGFWDPEEVEGIKAARAALAAAEGRS